MKSLVLGFAALVILSACHSAGKEGACAACGAAGGEEGFVSLFDGKSLEGWKASENPDTFKVQDGMLIVHGPRSHLFYIGPVGNHEFKNFHLKLQVMTKPGANSGVYFHTAWQDSGWPAKGFECQVNSTHTDRKKTGGLYAVQDVLDTAPSVDDQWFDYDILVQGKQVTLQVNGKTTTQWTEPTPPQPPQGMPGRLIGSGTLALQGHDPNSVVYYKNIRIKPLP